MRMTKPTTIEIHAEWRGISITVRYTPERFAGNDHIEVESEGKQPLPITQTGYRSHFLLPEELAEFDSPAAYVMAWLDHEADNSDWCAHEAARSQLSLFIG